VIVVLLFDRKQEAREYACLSNAAAPAASKPTTATSTVGILFDITRNRYKIDAVLLLQFIVQQCVLELLFQWKKRRKKMSR